VTPSLVQRSAAELLGTAFLLAGVVGSGIMAAKLAGGNSALALLCNTLPTGAILTVLILALGPVSGAHFNPAVTLAFLCRGDLTWRAASLYVVSQLLGGIATCRSSSYRRLSAADPVNGLRNVSPPSA
jgi:glycerol uptake facilitator-like aquaporin